MLTEPQARALAFLLNSVRPDWPIPSLLALFEKHQEVAIGPLTVAAMTKALEPSCKTPGPIFAVGDHWPAETRADLPPPQRCKVTGHDSYYAHNCGACRSERIAEKPEAVPTGAASDVKEENP